jgi:hypothetical protein
MQVVKTYLYPNIAEVQIMDTGFYKLRARVVYSRPIKIYQGVDNPIQVLVNNQDNKAVSVSGYAVQADIQDPTNKVTIKSYAVEFDNVAVSRGKIILDQLTIDSLDQRFYKLTFKLIKLSDNTEQPLYIDANYGVPLDLEVLPGYYSEVEVQPGIDVSTLDAGFIK